MLWAGLARGVLRRRRTVVAVSIPKIIHQTLPSKQKIDPAFQENIANLKRLNPGWEHRLYDDEDIPVFILNHYRQDVLDCYDLIDPRYGPARADFFRYLLMNVEGGVYLDIKSTAIRPLDDVLHDEDEYILSHWRNQSHEEFAGWGRWGGLGPEGEYQQWHIICAPRHPFLDAVIKKVQGNIEGCFASENCSGQDAVVNMTGPVAYTKAIQPILTKHPHRKVHIEDLGFRYTIFSKIDHHAKLSELHYTKLEVPILRFKKSMATDQIISISSKRFDNGVGDLLGSAFKAREHGGSTRIATFHATSLFYLLQSDRCVHEDNAPNCLYVPVQFELFGGSVSLFVVVGGIQIRLGVDEFGYIASRFDAAHQGTPPLFRIGEHGEGRFTVSWKEHFLSAEPGGKLIFNRTIAKRWESFSALYDPPQGERDQSVASSWSGNANALLKNPRMGLALTKFADHGQAEGIFNSPDGLPKWAENKEQICAEIAAHFAPFKILLKTKDEPERLRSWIAHHAAIVGLENLIIFDNMSTDPAVLKVYEEFRGRIQIVRFGQHHNMIHNTGQYPELYGALRASCRYFLFLDTDEHLALYDGNERFLFGEAILTFLMDQRPAKIFPATWVSNVTGFNNYFDLSQPHVWLSSGLKWGKPIISADCELSEFLNHNTQVDHSLYPESLTTNFFILHRRTVSPAVRIRANLRKLVAARLITKEQGVEDVLKFDIEKITPLTVRDYCREIRELATLEPNDELPTKRSFEIGEDGHIRWTEDWQRSDMQRFVACPQEYSGNMLADS